MSMKEGFRRVNKLGRVIGTTGASMMLCAVALGLIASRLAGSAAWAQGMGVFALLGVYLVVAGIVILTLAWIGEGFAEKDDSA